MTYIYRCDPNPPPWHIISSKIEKSYFWQGNTNRKENENENENAQMEIWNFLSVFRRSFADSHCDLWGRKKARNLQKAVPMPYCFKIVLYTYFCGQLRCTLGKALNHKAKNTKTIDILQLHWQVNVICYVMMQKLKYYQIWAWAKTNMYWTGVYLYSSPHHTVIIFEDVMIGCRRRSSS